jgi:RimJ/RimL family protein N-acetyltransferase
MFAPRALETPRLVLRAPRVEDSEAVFRAYASDPEVTRYLPWRAHKSVDVTRLFLQEQVEAWEAKQDWSWMITRRDSQEVIGSIAARRQAHRVELGYVLGRAGWSQGFMAEAAAAVVTEAFRDPTIFRVWAMCDVGNQASVRVLEKIGMQREGTLRRMTVHPSVSATPTDAHIFAIVR